MVTKAQMLKAIESLPEDATIDDAIECLEFVELIEKRLASADTAEMITQEEVERQVASWVRRGRDTLAG